MAPDRSRFAVPIEEVDARVPSEELVAEQSQEPLGHATWDEEQRQRRLAGGG